MMARKPAAKARAEKRAAKPKREKREKPTAEQISDRETQRNVANAVREMRPLIAAEAKAKKDKQAGFTKWKERNVTKRDIEFWIALDSEENREKIEALRAREDMIARFRNLPIGAQGEFAFQKRSVADKAYDEGYAAAMNDQPRTPPEHLAQAASQAWMRGHSDGVVALNVSRAQDGIRPIGDIAREVVEQARAARAATEIAEKQLGAAERAFKPEAEPDRAAS